MGYRLDVEDAHGNEFYGTKLYGYNALTAEEAAETYASYRYLQEIGKASEEDFFEYGCDNIKILTASEFKIFIEKYDKDLTEYAKYAYPGYMLEQPDIVKLLSNDDDKKIWWC